MSPVPPLLLQLIRSVPLRYGRSDLCSWLCSCGLCRCLVRATTGWRSAVGGAGLLPSLAHSLEPAPALVFVPSGESFSSLALFPTPSPDSGASDNRGTIGLGDGRAHGSGADAVPSGLPSPLHITCSSILVSSLRCDMSLGHSASSLGDSAPVPPANLNPPIVFCPGYDISCSTGMQSAESNGILSEQCL